MRNQNNYFTFLCLLILSISSCVIKDAKIPSRQTVTIYSDCLTKDNELLFKELKKNTGIKVQIIHLPTDTILRRLKKQSFNSKADLVLLKSLFGIYKANKYDLLQPWRDNNFVGKNYKSAQNTWAGIGIDPYIFLSKNDSCAEIESIGQLFFPENLDKWSTHLETTSELISMIAPILQRKTRKEVNEWIQSFKNDQHSQQNELDRNGIPLMTTEVLFTNYSTYLKMLERNDSLDMQIQLKFTNQNKRGAFYNMHCIGIVKQARNYYNAKLVVEYLYTPSVNEKLNAIWNTLPINMHKSIHPYAYQNTVFNLALIYNENAMANYPHISKSIKNTLKE